MKIKKKNILPILLALAVVFSLFSAMPISAGAVSETMGIAPAITGPESITLPLGYPETETDSFTITGNPVPIMKKTGGNAAVSWNDNSNKLVIAAGLGKGTYPIELTASNGVTPEAIFTFLLIVTDAETETETDTDTDVDTDVDTDADAETGTEVDAGATGSMSNFVKARDYSTDVFSDVNEDLWYGYNHEKVVASVYEYGLMEGYAGSRFGPSENMTIAEAITIAARVHSIYTQGFAVTSANTPPIPWYGGYVDYAVENGIIEDGDFDDFGKAVTRAEMAYIFAHALPETEFMEKNTVNSLPDVGDATPYRDEIFLLYRAGVLGGSDAQGTFNPNTGIVRAEAAAIVSRVILQDTRR